jgi:hypothetical protein
MAAHTRGREGSTHPAPPPPPPPPPQLRVVSPEPDFTGDAGRGGGGVPGSKARVMAALQRLGWDDVAAEVAATDEADIYERAILVRTRSGGPARWRRYHP